MYSKPLRALAAVVLLAASLAIPGSPVAPLIARAAPCTPPISNPVWCENTQPGNPRTEWDVTGAGDPSIQGFATDISVNKGQTVSFKVTSPSAYQIAIYRLGYYQGNGARRITNLPNGAAAAQPACLNDAATGLIDCGNWTVTSTWAVPADAVSGIYFAKITRTDSAAASSHIVFIVRDDASTAPMLFQTSDTTWQAYNDYGGNSLYTGAPVGRAYKVSYNRPFNTRSPWPQNWVFGAEYPMVRWLEANGYNVTYASGIDSDRLGLAGLTQHKVFLSVGHDEYWSKAQRANVEAARDAGLNLAFFSGNEVFWKTRYENSIDGSSTPYRTLVSYKETHADAKIDPSPEWTGTWRDPRFTPPSDGGRPENALMGTIFTVNGPADYRALQVPGTYANRRFWRNTSVASLAPNATAEFKAGCPTGCVVGYEWDSDLDNGHRPAGLINLSSSTYDVPGLLKDFGSTFGPGTATHKLTFYKHANGALVFGAGTVDWSWALDGNHDIMPSTPEPALQQATVNLFADMGVQPASLQTGLVPATASTDTAKPTSTFNAPAAASTVTVGTDVTISGIASDTGGVVAGVEVSVDGGNTWRPTTLNGTTWSFTWKVLANPGPLTLKSRAVDDSGNIEVPGAGRNVTVAPRVCPCSVYATTDAPAPQVPDDNQQVNLGMKFRTNSAGFAAGVRFYKLPANSGVHTGWLWSATGQLLGQTTFLGESGEGWQEAFFDTAIELTPNTTYIVSYHAPAGGYAKTEAAFAASGIDFPPLRALKSGEDGANGLFRYGPAGLFPDQTYLSSSYWVDVIFANNLGPGTDDGQPPTVVGNSPTGTTTPLETDVKATFSERVVGSSIKFEVRDMRDSNPNQQPALSGVVTYNDFTKTAVFNPDGALAVGATYSVTVSGAVDLFNNPMTAPKTWTFSTQACPCSFWNDSAVPVQPAQTEDSGSIEVGMHFKALLDGFGTGMRFYKGATNNGPHAGHLWKGDGTLLTTVNITTVAGSSGWQQATFGSPVALVKDQDYVISYHMPTGNYSRSVGFFSGQDIAAGPLVANKSGAVPNGVYAYGSTPPVFPTNTFEGTNYWVDVIYNNTNGTPSAPVIGGVQVSTITNNSAVITWTTDENSDSVIEYGTAPALGQLSKLDATMTKSHSIQLSGLNPGTTYHFRAKSRDSAWTAGLSATASFKTTGSGDATPPVISNVTTTAVDASKVTISWTTNEPADSVVEYGLTDEYGAIEDDATASTSHSITLTGLSASTVYHFVVKSKDAAGNPATSGDRQFTTRDVQITSINAQVPAGEAGETTATISWTTDAGADSQVEYGTNGYTNTSPVIPDLVTSHSVPLTGLTPGTLYHFRVKSTANNKTVVSGDNTFTTRDFTEPTISNVEDTSVSTTSHKITWTTDEPSTSQVEYGATTTYGQSTTATTALVTSHSVTISGLATGETYHFRVKSRDAANNLATSMDETFTTADNTPPGFVPNSIKVTEVKSNSAKIQWGTTELSDSQVRYGTNLFNLTSSTPVDPALVTSHTVNVTGLSPNTRYFFRVVSKDQFGNTAQSNLGTFVTAVFVDTTAPSVSAVQATSISSTGATIKWTTNEASTTQVEYGRTTSYGSSTTLNSSMVTSHTVTLAGLTPGAQYNFRVKSKDAAGNLAVSGNFTFTTLPVQKSLTFDGDDAYAEAPHAAELNITGDYTVEAWFKDEDSRGYNHLPSSIIIKGDLATDRDVPFGIGIAANQLFVVAKANDKFGYMYYDLARNGISPKAWHHVAVTMKASTKQVTLYIDGVQKQQGTFSVVSTAGNTEPISIGRNGGPSGYANWKGKVDDVRIWNTVRSASQISANYRTQFTSAQSGLVANWKADEGSGSVANDTAGSEQDAVLRNGATWSSDVHLP